MPDIALRQQAFTTLLLLLLAFALWFAAEPLFNAPAKWLAHILLTTWLPSVVATTIFEPSGLVVVTAYADLGDGTLQLIRAGEEGLAFRLNTRLVSYGIPFYAALLWGSRIAGPMNRFAWGLFVMWLFMALGLAAMAAKDMLLVLGDPFLSSPWVPAPPVIAVGYQFSVLLMPTVIPVLLWVLQLRGSPLWLRLEDQLANSRNKE